MGAGNFPLQTGRDRGWEANANWALGGGAALKWVEWV